MKNSISLILSLISVINTVLSKDCDVKRAYSCIREVKAFRDLKESTRKAEDFILQLGNTDVCEAGTSIIPCLQDFDPSCFEVLPDNMQTNLVEMFKDPEVLELMTDEDACNTANSYLRMLLPAFECGKSISEAGKYKKQSALIGSLENKVVETAIHACCVLKEIAKLNKDGNIYGDCDSETAYRAQMFDEKSSEILEKVCTSYDLEGKICQEILSQVPYLNW